MVNNSRWYILDDPRKHLDNEKIHAIIKDLKMRKKAIIATNDQSIIDMSDT